MDLRKMIAELQAEKQRLDEAIVALERLSAGKVRSRVRHDGLSVSSADAGLHEADPSDSTGNEFPHDGIVSN